MPQYPEDHLQMEDLSFHHVSSRDNAGSPDLVVAILQPLYFSCSTFSISEKCRHTPNPRYERNNNKMVPEVLAKLQALEQGLGCR